MLAAELLGDGQTAFMTQRLQFEDKTAIYATAYYRGTALDDTTFTTLVVPVPGVSLSEAEANMDRVLQEFLEEPIDTAHLDRIKRNMRAQEVFAKDNVQGLANRYGRALTMGLTVKDILDWPDVVEAVTEEEIKDALRSVLQEKTSVTGWLTSGVEATQ